MAVAILTSPANMDMDAQPNGGGCRNPSEAVMAVAGEGSPETEQVAANGLSSTMMAVDADDSVQRVPANPSSNHCHRELHDGYSGSERC